jgi:hypothetical protein
MYKKADGQITISEFISPFGKLSKENRWVKIADMIPWHKFEDKYAEQFCENNGNPAIPFRMAMGTLIIKQIMRHSDDDVLLDIAENVYMQYLIGLHEFVEEPPFSQSSISNFRKYISAEMIKEINDIIFAIKDTDDRDGEPPDDGGGTTESSEVNEEPEKNKGIMLLDATCTPANIAYPTDVNLLNEAREKLEGKIDTLHPQGYNGLKPRTYRQKARKDYLNFVKQRKPRRKAVRKAVGQQLRYVRRNIGHVERMIEKFGERNLSHKQREWLLTIRTLYRQQKQMYDTKTHSVEKRIVSIGQPHVRPIVRGKVKSSVEFGAKVSIHMIDGYAFIDKIGWDAYNEEALLIPTIEEYKERYGYYPVAVLVDKIYRNSDNRRFCKKHGIRISGPRLGRPPKETNKAVIRQERADASGRNAVEGKFGEGKTGYGLGRIMACLKDSSETVISMAIFCMNISKRLRILLRRFLQKFFTALFITGFYDLELAG